MKRYIKRYLQLVLLSLIMNFLIEAISRKSPLSAAGYLFRSPVVFALNALIILMPYTLVFVVRRKMFAAVLVSVFWIAMGAANGFLLTFRTTPFTAEDFRLIKYGLNMITNYLNWFQILAAVASGALVTAGCVVLWKKAPVDTGRLRCGVGCVILAATCAGTVGLTTLCMEAGVVAVHFGNIGQAFRDYGFPYCFSNSLVNTGIAKPEDYGVEALNQIEEEALAPEPIFRAEEAERPNIVMLQLESFFDPTLWKNNPVEEDPIPYFRYLYENYPSGYLSVPSVGAGTANTEFEVITGMNLDFFGPGEYPYKTVLSKKPCESTAFDLKNLGYTAHAIHNNEATFYDRNNVFAQLGFDTFIPIEYMYDVERNPIGWCRDEILTGEILKALDSTKGSDFIYTISVQGHGAYPDFQYYCSQIREMDAFVRELTGALNSLQEPTVLVMYGDHLPGFTWEAQDMKNHSLYQTNYVIWNNLRLPANKKTVEAYQLSAYVLDLVGIHEGTMLRFHQNYLNDQDMDEEEYLKNMEVLEYDMLYGEQEIYGGSSPYRSTRLKMGIDPIVVDRAYYTDSNLLVYGENFNSYSKICINGKPLETICVWPELLIAKDVQERKAWEGEITVRQIGRDKRPLGSARDERPPRTSPSDSEKSFLFLP